MKKILYATAMTVLMASPAFAENIGVSMAKFDDNFLTVLRNGMTRYLDAYANEIASFIAAATKGKKAAPSGKDGLIALKLADAALKSAKTGKTVRVD